MSIIRSRLPVLVLFGALLAVSLAAGVRPAAADPLQDLRVSLGKLSGREPIRASIEIQFRRTVTEDKVPKTTEGRITVAAEDGPEGLRISYPRALLDRASDEAAARSRNPETPTPTRTIISENGALDLRATVEAAAVLLRDLEDAKLKSVRADSSLGVAATLLELQVEPKLPASVRKRIKKLEVTARAWVDRAGDPIALSIRYGYRGSQFFIGFEGTSSEEYRFTRVGSRLVAREVTTEETGSGFGQKSEERKTIRVTID